MMLESRTDSVLRGLHTQTGGSTPRRRRLVGLLTALAVLLGVFVATSTPASADASPWTARTAAEANSWRSVTYGNGTFVAVAGNGTSRVMTSPDGVTWTARTAAEANYWTSVTYGNGTFVAVSSDGTSRVMTSADGVTWTARTAAAANYWQSVTFGNGTFVAVASTGQVMTSADGVTWTSRTAAAASTWYSVTYGNGTFVAVAYSGRPTRVMTSADGVTWTAQTAAHLIPWVSVTYGNGTFVAVSSIGFVMTSADGVEWADQAVAEANSWYSVSYGNGTFVAVSVDGTNQVMTSPDGVTWTAQAAAEANSWYSVSYGNGTFVAVSLNGTSRVMTLVPASAPAAPTSLVATPGDGSVSVAFTAGSDGGASISNYKYSIDDGASWSAFSPSVTSSPVSITGLTNGTTYAVKLKAVNSEGDGAASDAVSVTPRTVPSAPTSLVGYRGYRSAEVSFAAGSNGGSAITNYKYSTDDGATWTALSPAVTSSPVTIGGLTNSTTYNIKLRAVNAAGDGAVSDAVSVTPGVVDAISWTARDAAEANLWVSVTYGNGLFVAVSTTGTHRVMTSSDGVSWTARDASEVNRWRSVVYANGLFVAVAVDGSHPVMTSSLAGVPAAPTSLVATPGNGSVSVSFTAGSDGGSPITNYEYELDGSGSWYSFSPAVTTPRVIIPVTNGVSYTVKLRAVNAVGSGAASVASASFTPRTVPSAPTGLVATRGDGQVSIAFTAGADGGTAITKYQYTIDDGGSWFDAEEGTSSPVTIGGLTNGTTYSIRLRAYSALRGTASAAVTVTPKTTLSAPTSLVATPGDGQVTIAFTAGANGGAAITKYQYRVGNGPWTDAVGTTSPITITGVANYTNPKVRIRAVNVSGPGAASAAVTARTRLAGPSLNSATAGVRSSVHVEYSELTIPDATINGYTATVYLKGTNTAVSTCHTNRNGRSCDIRKLSVGTEYDVRVVTYFKVTGDPIIRQTLDSNTVTVTTAN